MEKFVKFKRYHDGGIILFKPSKVHRVSNTEVDPDGCCVNGQYVSEPLHEVLRKLGIRYDD